MNNMFYGAEQFHHSLNEWNINNKVNIRGIFVNTNYPKKYIESWREKVGEEMFEKAFLCECGKENNAPTLSVQGLW